MIGRFGRTGAPSGRTAEHVVAGRLLEQQGRFAAIDRQLPPPVPPPPGDVLVAGDGVHEVAAVVTHHHWPAGSAPLLWSAAEVTELHPVVGDGGAPAMHALVAGWRGRMSSRVLHARDSAAIVTWPSRDVDATRVFLDHGLTPLAVLAVRPARAGSRDDLGGSSAPGVRVRRAGPDDVEDCVRLAMEEVVYSSQVGGSVLRANAEAVKRTALDDRLGRGDPVWLAERDGVVVGMLECGHVDIGDGSWLAGMLLPGRWGYVNCASVVPSERGTGAGGALVTTALAEMATPDVRGTYLYYNPPNPLSSVFWPRRGYRPLWTLWETRPASSLR